MNRIQSVVLLLGLLSSGALFGADGHNPLLPRPQKVQYGNARLALTGLEIGFAASPTPQDRFAAEQLAAGLQRRANVAVHVSDAAEARHRILLVRTGSGPDLPQPDDQPGPDSREAYTIKVTADGAEIRAPSSTGLFYGVQTLLQLVEGSGAAATIPEVEIHDWPSLAYRGTMVDMSHGPLPTEEEIRLLHEEIDPAHFVIR
jgi:hexosaminidase